MNNWVPDTKGTIHPDMLRVLHQDGFETEVLWPGASDTPARLRAHLDGGHLTVILIDAGAMHWVVGAGCEGDDLLVCDSLEPRIYREPTDRYLAEKVYPLVLVRASGS